MISVIIPVYNVEKYLEQCLNSIINQTLKNIEIICVNDCSTDKSLHILKEFVLKDIEEYIESFKNEYFIQDFDYEEEKRIVEVERPLVTKLQDSLLVLPKVNASMELVLLVKAKIKITTSNK